MSTDGREIQTAVQESLPADTPPQVNAPSSDAPWTARQQQFVDRARDHSLRLEGMAYAYRKNVKEIEFLQQLLDVACFALAIWALFALWVVGLVVEPGEHQRRVSDWVTVIGTALSLAVVTLLVWSWRGSWTPKAEKLRELASRASALSSRFRAIIEAERFDETTFKRTETELRGFEEAEDHPLAGIRRRFKQLAFQHVGQRHPEQNITCNTCGRKWDVLSPRRHSTWTFFRWWNCPNCGIAR